MLTQPQAADTLFLTSAQLRRRYGGIGTSTLARWLEDPDFPRPVVISKRHYWRLDDLLAFEARATLTRATA